MGGSVWSVEYLGFHFGGGGVQNIFWKSGGISAWQSHTFAMGVNRGHALPRKFFKWCNLVRFGEYFAKIL